MIIIEITSPAALQQLREEWTALWAGSPAATPFQSPAWLIPWWHWFGSSQLWTLTVREADRLVGLLPCYIQEGNCRFIGTGISDYLDALAAPDLGDAIGPVLMQHLARAEPAFQHGDWHQLRPGSPLLTDQVPANLVREVREQEICPVLELPETIERLPEQVSSHQLEKYQYYWRRAEKLGRLDIEHATEANLDECLAVLVQLHQARWSERGGPGVLADDAMQSFHRESATAMLRAGVLRIYVLRLDGRALAALYGFLQNRTFFYYVSGFDPAFRQVSPGTLIVGHAIHEAVREGAQRFDLLRGQESYKYRWGAYDTFTYRLQMKRRV